MKLKHSSESLTQLFFDFRIYEFYLIFSDERPWVCDICFKSYKLKHHLKAHMETKHASAKPFPCKLCDFR